MSRQALAYQIRELGILVPRATLSQSADPADAAPCRALSVQCRKPDASFTPDRCHRPRRRMRALLRRLDLAAAALARIDRARQRPAVDAAQGRLRSRHRAGLDGRSERPPQRERAAVPRHGGDGGRTFRRRAPSPARRARPRAVPHHLRRCRVDAFAARVHAQQLRGQPGVGARRRRSRPDRAQVAHGFSRVAEERRRVPLPRTGSGARAAAHRPAGRAAHRSDGQQDEERHRHRRLRRGDVDRLAQVRRRPFPSASSATSKGRSPASSASRFRSSSESSSRCRSAR